MKNDLCGDCLGLNDEYFGYGLGSGFKVVCENLWLVSFTHLNEMFVFSKYLSNFLKLDIF